LKGKKTELVVKAFEKFLAETIGHDEVNPDESTLKVVFSDNAPEFEEKQMGEIYRNYGIKHITGRSHRPIVLVEACNNQIRKIMRQLFIRNKNLNWIDHLGEIQQSKNTQFDTNLKAMPENILTDFLNKKDLSPVTEKIKNRAQKHNDKFKNATFARGQAVRIKLSAIQSHIRQQEKSGQGKYVVVHYTPEVFYISRVYPVKEGKIGLPTYTVQDTDTRVIIDKDNKFVRFRQSDLLKVNPNTVTTMNQANANKLNQTNEEFNILRQGDLEPPREVPQAPRPPRPSKAPLQFKSQEWNQHLKDKIFIEKVGRRNVEWKIKEIKYDRRNKQWMCYYLPVNARDNTEPESSLLWEVLQDAKNSKGDWYNAGYDAVIEQMKK
jgi:hypothetical protein